MKVDLLIHSASQLLTCAAPNSSLGGHDQGAIGLVEDGAVAALEGQITHVGHTDQVAGEVDAAQEIDAGGCVVLPGFVDAHTHLVFAGDRVGEFEQRVSGATYQEIMAGGGGIMSTVQATRAAAIEDQMAQSRPRLNAMLAQGTTTAEVKTGYGLSLAHECEMLKTIEALDEEHPVRLVPTFLGAHAIPAEFEDRADAYLDLVVEEMLPAAAEILDETTPRFCDVFCEEGAFTLEHSRRVLEAGRDHGFDLKIHVDEFEALGGAALAAELGATTADHLAVTSEGEMRAMARAGVIGVLLPGTTFGLASTHYANARRMIDLELPVALGTDLNPGTCWCPSMPFMMALATRYMAMTPAEAVVAATINAAYASGVGGEVGSLELGKQADLVVLSVADYRHLAYRIGENLVRTVVKGGEIQSGQHSKQIRKAG